MTSAEKTSESSPSSAPAAGGRLRIGLFDSGVGGLSVLRAVRRELPAADLVYVADQYYCPYGPRPPAEICALAARIVSFLRTRGCDAVVVACNTASAAALSMLRERNPDLPIIGMEPAVKPAALATRSGKIAVLATRGTLDGELFQTTRAEYAGSVDVQTIYPQDWVARVERGEIDTPETRASVSAIIQPLLDWGVDEIALGCTHYPFLAPLIDEIAQGRAAVLDPSSAVARQTARVVASEPGAVPGTLEFFTSGDPAEFRRVLVKLLSLENATVTAFPF